MIRHRCGGCSGGGEADEVAERAARGGPLTNKKMRRGGEGRRGEERRGGEKRGGRRRRSEKRGEGRSNTSHTLARHVQRQVKTRLPICSLLVCFFVLNS